jgi:His-Xaa-Ser system protein HxsD
MVKENKNINFKISEKIYPLEVVFLACYNYIDKAYIYLDQNKTGEFEVTMIGKNGVNASSMKEIVGEFHNELLFSALRQKISKNNKRLREAIVFAALFSAQGNNPESLIDKDMGDGSELSDDVNNDEWKNDPLGIAVSWEEKRKMKGKGGTIEKKKIVKNKAKNPSAGKKKKK